MKSKADIVRGWLRKAHSDLLAMDASVSVGALDAACFHAQQAAEKYFKAFLVHASVQFPFTHNLSKLLDLCVGVDPSFSTLLSTVEPLTPYAVEMRYDGDFWPEDETVQAARRSALAVRDFVFARIGDSFPEQRDPWQN